MLCTECVYLLFVCYQFNDTSFSPLQTTFNSQPAVAVYTAVTQRTYQRQYQTGHVTADSVRLQLVTVQSQVQCRTALCDTHRAHSRSLKQAHL
jgi:hypothetical protein